MSPCALGLCPVSAEALCHLGGSDSFPERYGSLLPLVLELGQARHGQLARWIPKCLFPKSGYLPSGDSFLPSGMSAFISGDSSRSEELMCWALCHLLLCY